MAQANDQDFFLESKEELDKQHSSQQRAPLTRDVYVAKIGLITLVKSPLFADGRPHPTQKVPSYQVILLPCGLKAGGLMLDEEGQEVSPFTKYIWRSIDPFSTGFNQQGKPSFLRSLISTMENSNPKDRLKAAGFTVVDKNLDEVFDKEVRNKVLAELSSPEKDLLKQGYKIFPDIRMYQDMYIACSIEVNKSNKNVVSDFSALPQGFQSPNESEYQKELDNFQAYYDKVSVPGTSQKESNSDSFAQFDNDIVSDEVVIEDVPL